MQQFLNSLTTIGTNAAVKILLGLVVLFVGIRLSKWIIRLISKGKGFGKLDKGVRSFIVSFTRIVLYAAVISSTAILWGVPTTAFVTLFTSAGVAIGLAVQGALSNFAGGVLILVFKPFKVGDFIENGSVIGTVKEITVIYTTIATIDNKIVTIPNGSLTNSNIINYSTMKERMVDMTINAAYSADIDTVESILLEVAKSNPKVLNDPAPVARLSGHGSDAMEYVFRVWCKSEDYWDVKFDCLENVKKQFDEHNINIPYKQVDIHNV